MVRVNERHPQVTNLFSLTSHSNLSAEHQVELYISKTSMRMCNAVASVVSCSEVSCVSVTVTVALYFKYTH